MTTAKTDLAKTITKAIHNDERTADSAIEVTDQNGLITLTGQVETDEERRAAGEIAEAFEQVISVTNDIELVEVDTVTRVIPGGFRPTNRM